MTKKSFWKNPKIIIAIITAISAIICAIIKLSQSTNSTIGPNSPIINADRNSSVHIDNGVPEKNGQK
jgi:hypothetical protein